MATISIIVPVYNTETYLHRCVDSILAQTFTDFELLLVDDGSKDGSGIICDEYAERDARVRVFHQENQGQAAARNHALDWLFANSDSEYISFVDSDDWVHPRYLELLLEGLRRYGVNISQCLYVKTQEWKPHSTVGDEIVSISSEEEYISWYSAFFWDKLFRRVCFQTMRFPEGQIFEDVAIWYKILFAEHEIALIEEPLYYYFFRAESTVNSSWRPAHYAQVEAWSEQLRFFEEYGNKRVIDAAAEHAFQVLALQLTKIESSNSITRSDKKTYRRKLRREMRRNLWKYHSNSHIQKSKTWYYKLAYPRISWLYWTLSGLLKHFSK